jgi:hypothetical protein
MREFENLLADHDAHADALLARYEYEVEQSEMEAEREGDRLAVEAATKAKTTWDAMRSTRGRYLDDDLDDDLDPRVRAGLDADREREDAWWNDDLERDYAGPDYDHEIETDPDYWAGRR